MTSCFCWLHLSSSVYVNRFDPLAQPFTKPNKTTKIKRIQRRFFSLLLLVKLISDRILKQFKCHFDYETITVAWFMPWLDLTKKIVCILYEVYTNIKSHRDKIKEQMWKRDRNNIKSRKKGILVELFETP